MRLKDKVALITGAARGIGLGFAEAYAREGAKVIIADINIERAEEAARGIGPSVKAVKLDVTDLRQIDKVVVEIDAEYGGIDILVNNAAIFDMAPINELTEDSYERVLGINLKGPLFMMKAVSNVMIKRGRGGKIINMASQAGRRGEALVTLYCASKAAIISATQSAALALVKHGINVNAIAPGVVDGEHWDVVDANFAKWEGLKPGEKKRRWQSPCRLVALRRRKILPAWPFFLPHLIATTSSPRLSGSTVATGWLE